MCFHHANLECLNFFLWRMSFFYCCHNISICLGHYSFCLFYHVDNGKPRKWKIWPTGTESSSFLRHSLRIETLSKSEAKSFLNEYRCTSWNIEYQANERGSASKILLPSIHLRSIPVTSRKYETILFPLRSGHCRLRAHLRKIGRSDSSLCENCNIPEIVTHFLLQCPQYENNRSLFKKVTANPNILFSLHSVLSDPRLLTHTVEFALASGKST